MKCLVDMALSPLLATWLATRGHDALHAMEVGLSAAPDEVVLAYAVQEQRVVITADLDFPRLLILLNKPNHGLILFRSGHYSEQDIEMLLERMLQQIPEQELRHSLIVIERTRIRKRRLTHVTKN